MNSQNNNKPWYKKWWLWVIIIVVVIIFGSAISNDKDDTSTKTTNGNSESETKTTKVSEPKKWTKVSELSGDTQQKSGEIFALTGGNVRIKYTINATADSGTTFVYLLPEGSTISQNAQGELDVAVQDVTTFGTKSGEKVFQKPAGNYYLFVNSSSIKDYSMTLEEQQ